MKILHCSEGFAIIFHIFNNFNANFWTISLNFRASPNSKIFPRPSQNGPPTFWRTPSTEKSSIHYCDTSLCNNHVLAQFQVFIFLFNAQLEILERFEGLAFDVAIFACFQRCILQSSLKSWSDVKIITHFRENGGQNRWIELSFIILRDN